MLIFAAQTRTCAFAALKWLIKLGLFGLSSFNFYGFVCTEGGFAEESTGSQVDNWL